MKKLEEFSHRMKADWDRRVDHDYRFWMSDGWSSDEVMWQSGERDLGILLQDIIDTESKTFLEIGCGVGRILRAASSKFKQATGIDVSESAIKKAKELIGQIENVQCICGNGVDLSNIESKSIDCLISFAALTSMPTDVIAAYLLEMNRVLSDAGTIRLQVYLGSEQPVREGDTLHLRCYQQANFIAAVEKAGFSLEWVRELNLPFQVSFKDIGIEAVIISLKKQGGPSASASDISATLLPAGEIQETEIIDGDALEYWMSVNYAKELAEIGEIDKAREALGYAEVVTRTMSTDVQDSLQILLSKLNSETDEKETQIEVSQSEGSTVFDQNLRALKDQFPEVAQQVQAYFKISDKVEIVTTGDGPAIIFNGQCLDHPTKPISAAGNWARQAIQSKKVHNSQSLVVYGLAAGYHIEELFKVYDRSISVVEPSLDVFCSALKLRDFTAIFSRVEKLKIGNCENFELFDENTELIVRPQSQGIDSNLYQKLRANFYGVRGLATLKPKIAVLGPIMGGTLPIMSYTSLALGQMQQRVREVDMSDFAPAYNAFSKVVSNETLKANSLAGFVDTLSKTVVNALTEKPADILICMAQAPISADALTELRKRGVITVLWFVEDYLRFTTWKTIAPFYDFIFTIQKDGCMSEIKKAGCPEVHYLPTACEPLVHAPLNLSNEDISRWGSDVSFVGAGYHNRQQMFASLAHYPFKIWGTEWPECKPFDRLVQEKGRRIKPEEYVKIFNASKINLNLHSSTERDGIDPYGDFLNPRTFELASCEAFQLTDPRSLLGEVLTAGEDIITFENTEDLKGKINYYIENEDQRRDIAKKARKTVHEKHTYKHRLREMLSIIYSSKYEQLKSREDASPWNRMISMAADYPELQERCRVAQARGEEPSLDALVSDIVTGEGELSDTEMKLLFLFHVSKQIIRHKREELGEKAGG